MSVSSVEWRLDGVRIGSIQYTAPYSISLDTATVANGQHNIAAYVLDAAGNLAVSSIPVTFSNSIPSTGPTVPGDTTTVPPPSPVTQTTLNWAIVDSHFTNTLDERSLASIEAELLINTTDATNPLGNTYKGYYLNVVDFGAVGDGVTDDTTAIQNTLDAGAASGTPVLFPGGHTFAVTFGLMDSWYDGYWGQLGYAFKVKSNTTIKIEGIIKPIGASGELLNWPSGWCLFENENNFRHISGDIGTDVGYDFPAIYTGDRQGLVEASGCHTNGVISNVLQILGDVDLSSVVVGEAFTCPPVENLLPLMEPRNVAVRVDVFSGTLFRSEITAIDTVAKTITMADPITVAIPANSPVKFTIENNLFDEDIKIYGTGSIDLGGCPTNWYGYYEIMAFRFYRIKNLSIDGITIKKWCYDGCEIGFSQNVQLTNLTWNECYDAETSYASCINLDVCRNTLIENCNFYDNPLGSAIFVWACRDTKVINCTAVDMPYGGIGIGGLVDFQGYSFEFYSVTLPTNLVDSSKNATECVWGMHEFTPLHLDSLDNFGDMINWGLIIDGCTSSRNGWGITILAETYFGGFGSGIIITNNIINSNKFDGIDLGSGYQTIISNNEIRNNGWGNSTIPYNKSNYLTSNQFNKQPFYD